MMRIVILLSCMCFVCMVILVSPVISFAPSNVVSVVRVQAATKMETMISAKKAVQGTISFLEEVTEAVTHNVVPDVTIADALAKAGIAGAAAVVASLQRGHTKKSEVPSKPIDDSDSLSQEVTAVLSDIAIPDATMVVALASTGMGDASIVVTSLQLGDTKEGIGSVDITPPVTLLSVAHAPAAKITAFLAESDLDSSLSLSPAAARTSEAPGLKPVTSLSSSSGEEVTAAMKNNVAPDATMAVALANTGIAGAAAVVSSFQRFGMKKSKGSSMKGDDSFSLSQEVTAAMANNAMPDATMAASLSTAGIAGAAAVVSYLQGGKGIGALDIPPSVTLSSVFDDQIAKTTASSAESDLNSTLPLSFAAVKTATATGLKPVTSSSSSDAGKPAAVAPVPGGSYLETLSRAVKPAAEAAVSSGSYRKSLLGSAKPAAEAASVSGGSYLNTLSGATKPTASVPERPPSSVKCRTSRSSAIGGSSIDNVSAAAERVSESPAEGDREMQGVIERLKTELELACEFFSLNKIKSAPRPIPPSSDLSPFVSKDAALESASVDTILGTVQGSVIADSSPVAYESATAAVDASSAAQAKTTRIPPSEVIERLKTELELAHKFFSLNAIKPAPRPMPRGSVSSTVVLIDAGLETASFDTLSDAVQGSLIADSSPVAYESPTAAVDASSATQVEAPRVPPREVIIRLTTELELAREFFSLNTIKSAPRPIPRGSVSSTVVLKDAGPETTSIDTLTDAIQASLIADFSPAAYESATSAVYASSDAQVGATRVPPRKVIGRLITEIELARAFFSVNTIKSVLSPIPRGSVLGAVLSKDAGLEAASLEKMRDAVQDREISDFSSVAHESATTAVDASSAAQVEATRVPPREVIERLKNELELAHEFLSLHAVKSAPRPIPRGSVSGAVLSKDAGLEAASVDKMTDAVQDREISDFSPLAYESATTAVDASIAAQVEVIRVPPREVIERLKTELELAHEYFSLRKIKSAPRPIPRGSVLGAVLSKDAGLEATSVDKMKDAVQDRMISDFSPVAYESATTAVDASSAAQVEATRVPPREVIERLKTEIELAREFFSLHAIKSAPRPIPRGSVLGAVILEDAGGEIVSFDTLSDVVQDSLIADSSPVAYESATTAVDASSAAQVEATRVPPREVIDRLKTELELACDFFSLNPIKLVPLPIHPGSASSNIILKDAGLDELLLDKPTLAFDPRDENIFFAGNCSMHIISVGSTTAAAFPATLMDELSPSQVKASRVEVIERLKLELDLARDFIAQNEIKLDPHPIPRSSVSCAFVSKSIDLDKKPLATPASAFGPRYENISPPGSSSAVSMSVCWTTTDANPDTSIDKSSASQVQASRFEAMERLKRELDLARDFIAQNERKRAPRPIALGSISSAFVSKCVGLDETMSAQPISSLDPHDDHVENVASPGNSLVDTMSVGSTASNASPAATIDSSRTYQMKTSRVQQIAVMERLKHELDLALEFFYYTTIKPAPHPVPPRSSPTIAESNVSDSSAFLSRDLGLDAMRRVKPAPAFIPNNDVSSPVPGSSSGASSASQIKVARVLPREGIDRLIHELELASEFFSHNWIKSAPSPMPHE